MNGDRDPAASTGDLSFGEWPERIPGDEAGDMEYAMPVGDPCLITLALSEADGVTTLTTTMTFASKEARDGAVSTGMTGGMEVGYARIDDMFEKAA